MSMWTASRDAVVAVTASWKAKMSAIDAVIAFRPDRVFRLRLDQIDGDPEFGRRRGGSCRTRR